MFFWNSFAFSMIQQMLEICLCSFCLLKSSLYTWDLLVHILLKHNLENFEYYIASLWSECNFVVVWTLTTWHEELTQWKRSWCWEIMKAGGEGDNRGWDGWMASPTQWIWVWVNARNWLWAGKSGVLQSMGSQTVGHDWVTELNILWHFLFLGLEWKLSFFSLVAIA